MKTAVLIQVHVNYTKKGMKRSVATQLYRKLYGYTSLSNYGKYEYKIEGILGQLPLPDGMGLLLVSPPPSGVSLNRN
ncbi:MAG: hypothetical protein ACP5MW_06000, partial [Thermoplasmata archaeon]